MVEEERNKSSMASLGEVDRLVKESRVLNKTSIEERRETTAEEDEELDVERSRALVQPASRLPVERNRFGRKGFESCGVRFEL